MLMIRIGLVLFLATTTLEAQDGNGTRVTLFFKTFVRSTGEPETTTEAFSLPPEVHGPFELTVVNGDSTGDNRVSSATISVNSDEVLGPSDFNQNVETIERGMSLASSNTLAVELRSKPGSFLKLLITGTVPPDTKIGQSAGTIRPSGGTLSVPGIADVEIPSGAVTASTDVTLTALSSPFIVSLVPQLGSTFSLTSSPQLQITVSSQLAAPLLLRFSIPGLNTAATPSVVFLARQTSAGEEIDSLLPIGGSVCGAMLVCATILPDWFAFDTALYPNGSSLKLAVGTSTATLTSSSTPESLAVNAATQAPVRLWTVQNLAPTTNNVVLSTTDVLDMSATLMFQNPMLFLPLSSVFITGAFGFNLLRLHAGVDLLASDGTPVFNALDGTAQNQFDPGHPGTCSGQPTPLGYGENVLMTHGNGNFQTRYAHLQTSQVSDGITYVRGAQIALSDTDHTCQPHLHFEVRLADPPGQLPQPIDPAPLLPTGVFPDDYAGGLQFEVTVDGHIADLENMGPNFTFSHQFPAQTLLSLIDSGQGPHKLELLLVSPKLGVHSLHIWNLSPSPGENPAVRLNPFGAQSGAGPYNVEVVDKNLMLTPAPQDITVTLFREVISQCSGLLFSSNRTVIVLQGQTSASYNFNAGHDPACFSLPITTRYTVTQAVQAPNTILNLSGVPAQQLVLAVTR